MPTVFRGKWVDAPVKARRCKMTPDAQHRRPDGERSRVERAKAEYEAGGGDKACRHATLIRLKNRSNICSLTKQVFVLCLLPAHVDNATAFGFCCVAVFNSRATQGTSASRFYNFAIRMCLVTMDH